MLRKLMIFGLFAAASASIPAMLDSNPQMLRWFASSSAGDVVAAKVETPQVQSVNLSGRRMRLEADERGHFSGNFRINGSRVPAMIDTGATVVAINRSTARRIGLSVALDDFQHSVDTANGRTKAAAVSIDRLEIGRIIVEDVQAVVLEDSALSGTLIGMSFLGRLSKYQVENGALVMVQ
jgi:aspartyl protease family protein